MDVKQYLKQIQYVDADINSRLRELDTIKASLLTGQQLSGDNVQTNRVNHVEITYQKLVELDEQINEKINQLYELRLEISQAIDLLSDGAQRIILRERYINRLQWEEIAACIEMDISYTQRIHGYALENLSKIIKRNHEKS